MGREPRDSRREALPHNFYAAPVVCGLLLLAVALVFGQTVQHGFVNDDDDVYVCNNSQVAKGLTAQGVGWAFTTSYGCMWGPLTWLSHMLDCQLYGLRPWGHHLTNILLHAATTIILFLVLRRMTGDLWPSAFVAALFAVHPLHVESVAWVAERKGLLSGLFFVLTIGAYVGYVRHRFSLLRYLAVVILFALGLLAKPMLVTLPFVLLLLDYWPLGRMVADTPRVPSAVGAAGEQTAHGVCLLRWLVVEKIPLLALTAASCVATPFTQGEAVTRLDVIRMSSRITNALFSYVAYVGQFFCPVGLAAFYPHPGSSLPIWKALGALVLLVGVSAAAVAWRRRCPCVFVGWFWYLGTLVPMIGLVQVGWHAMADRYAYLTQIGLYLALAWVAAQVAASWPYRRWVYGVASALVVSLLMGCAWRQTTYWRNSETLWTRTLARTSRNWLAHYNLGVALAGRGQVDEAIAHYRKALEIEPNSAATHSNLGMALAGRGQVDEAITHYRKALEIQPNRAEAHHNLGTILAGRGQVDEAIAHYRKALEIEPNSAATHNNLGMALDGEGKIAEAVVQWREAVRLQPKQIAFVNNLAWVLATCPEVSVRDGAGAVELAQRAVQLSGGREPAILDTLAAAYAEAGRFPEAVQTARNALELATRQNKQALVESLQAKLPLYQAGTPFRQPLSPSPTPQSKP